MNHDKYKLQVRGPVVVLSDWYLSVPQTHSSDCNSSTSCADQYGYQFGSKYHFDIHPRPDP